MSLLSCKKKYFISFHFSREYILWSRHFRKARGQIRCQVNANWRGVLGQGISAFTVTFRYFGSVSGPGSLRCRGFQSGEHLVSLVDSCCEPVNCIRACNVIFQFIPVHYNFRKERQSIRDCFILYWNKASILICLWFDFR